MTMTESQPLPQYAQSERLIIRPSTREDAPYLQRWWNDPIVMDAAGQTDGMQYDDDDMEAWFRRYVDQRPYARHFVICLRDSANTPIGEFYISGDDRPGCICFAMLIGEKHLWGRGYAREAIRAYADALFSGCSCGAMRLDVRRDDERVLATCYALGFEVERVWANGRFQTMILTQAAYELAQGRTNR